VLLLRAASSASLLRKRKMLPRSASLRSSSRWLLSACRPHATCAAPARPQARPPARPAATTGGARRVGAVAHSRPAARALHGGRPGWRAETAAPACAAGGSAGRAVAAAPAACPSGGPPAAARGAPRSRAGSRSRQSAPRRRRPRAASPSPGCLPRGADCLRPPLHSQLQGARGPCTAARPARLAARLAGCSTGRTPRCAGPRERDVPHAARGGPDRVGLVRHLRLAHAVELEGRACAARRGAAASAAGARAAAHGGAPPPSGTSQRAQPRRARAWADELEGADGRVVRDLLQEDAGAVGQVRLPGLAQDGVERLAPRLEHVLQARHKPAAAPARRPERRRRPCLRPQARRAAALAGPQAQARSRRAPAFFTRLALRRAAPERGRISGGAAGRAPGGHAAQPLHRVPRVGCRLPPPQAALSAPLTAAPGRRAAPLLLKSRGQASNGADMHRVCRRQWRERVPPLARAFALARPCSAWQASPGPRLRRAPAASWCTATHRPASAGRTAARTSSPAARC